MYIFHEKIILHVFYAFLYYLGKYELLYSGHFAQPEADIKLFVC